MTDQHIESHASVKQWAASAGHHHDPAEVCEQRLRILAAFCAMVGKQPDELVAFCILRKKTTGEQFLSVKRRETINDWLEEFTAEQGWAGKQAVVNANVVRSFLIHNGVLIQGPVWRG
ncbi:MAG TPA: hypothetical protein VF223_24690 [Trebonia sp.]